MTVLSPSGLWCVVETGLLKYHSVAMTGTSDQSCWLVESLSDSSPCASATPVCPPCPILLYTPVRVESQAPPPWNVLPICLGDVQDEVEEVEAKLEASEQQPRTKWQRVLTRLCTPVFLEALILTFLAGQQLLIHLKAIHVVPAIAFTTRM